MILDSIAQKIRSLEKETFQMLCIHSIISMAHYTSIKETLLYMAL